MSRLLLRTTLIAVLLSPLTLSSVKAGDPGQSMGNSAYPQPAPYPSGYAGATQSGYPQLNASLYPCPRPDVPAEQGGALITNQALYPHEMLYAHTYKAVYPPYYYKTKWKWGYRIGVKPEGKWYSFPCIYRTRVACKTKLTGTQVTVKYHSFISPWALFAPPNASTYFH